MENKPEIKVTLIYWPEERELMLFKRCIWVTMGKTEAPVSAPSSKLLRDVLNARHSPVRVLNFAFLIENIPSNTATHFARHVHAVPFVSSLRNDRQDRMTVANKRLCSKASAKTREVAGMMCDEAAKAMPEIAEFLVPNCLWHGGVCHELESCGRCIRG